MLNPLTPDQFDASLTHATIVEARWTSVSHRYVALAHVVKVKRKSILVSLDADVTEAIVKHNGLTCFNHVYMQGNTITLPRYASAGYSANNGAYPVADAVADDAVDMIQALREEEAREDAGYETLPPDDGPFWENDPPLEAIVARGRRVLRALAEAEAAADAPVPLVLDLGDACGELGEEETRYPEGFARLYTTAPRDLDLAETVCLEDVGVLMGKDGRTSLPYWKVRLPMSQEAAQAAAYGSGGWNTHTPAEWAELLEQAWFQQRFVPRGCEAPAPDPGCPGGYCEPRIDTYHEGIGYGPRASEADHAPLAFSNPLSYPAYAPRHNADATSGRLNLPLIWLGDHAPAPSFDRDDATWLASLDVMLTPEAITEASSVATLHDAAWSSDPVTQVLILAGKGAEAVASAVASGQLRWGSGEQGKAENGRPHKQKTQRNKPSLNTEISTFLSVQPQGATLQDIYAAMSNEQKQRSNFEANCRSLLYVGIKSGRVKKIQGEGKPRYLASASRPQTTTQAGEGDHH